MAPSTGPAQDASTEGMKAAGYYDAHSEYQRRVIEGGDTLIRSAVATLPLPRGESAVAIVDYGASTGATSVHAVDTALRALRERDFHGPVVAIHNDVASNDFTQLFRNIAASGGYLGVGGGPIYPAAVAGSFFAQVLPAETVHLGMCSNAAHWLSEQPSASVEGMYFSDATGSSRAALADQAAADWLSFLGARAGELAPGGRLLVQGIASTADEGRTERVSASRLLDVMWQVAGTLADDGLLARQVLEAYVFPVYCRSADEAAAPLRAGAALAGSLEIVSQEIDEVSNPYWEVYQQGGDARAYAETYIEFVRAFAESTLLTHLFTPGATGIDPEALCDEYFKRLTDATAGDPEAGRYEAWVLRTVFEKSSGR